MAAQNLRGLSLAGSTLRRYTATRSRSACWAGRCSAPRLSEVLEALTSDLAHGGGFDLANESRCALRAQLRPGKLRDHLLKNPPGMSLFKKTAGLGAAPHRAREEHLRSRERADAAFCRNLQGAGNVATHKTQLLLPETLYAPLAQMFASG